MGLDASVMCNCYQEGKTKPCPFPDKFYVDEYGFPAVHLAVYDNEHISDQFDEWLSTCCEHPNMDHTVVYIANWKGYRSFVEALEGLGWENFPTLKAELPESNEGLTPADVAATALKELETFKTLTNSVQKVFLVNSDTQAVIEASAADQTHVFGLDGRTGLNIGVDENGFFVLDTWELNRELFRAMRFEQRVLESDGLDKPQQYEYVDLDSDRRLVSSTPVRLFIRSELGDMKQEYPAKMHVEKRGVNTAYFDYILEPLTTVFQAAVETGNPVRWG